MYKLLGVHEARHTTYSFFRSSLVSNTLIQVDNVSNEEVKQINKPLLKTDRMKIWVALYSYKTHGKPKGTIDQKIKDMVSKIESARFNCQSLGFRVEEDLLIFMAPEWAFRDWEGETQYTLEEMNYILKKIQSFSDIFPSILIVPGSIFYGVKQGDHTDVYNCSAVIYEGKIITVIHKWLHADILILKRQEEWGMFNGISGEYNGKLEYLINNWDVLKKNNKSIFGKHLENIKIEEEDNNGLFSLKGLSFGLETCKDACKGRLKKLLNYDISKSVDIHLIIGNGTTYHPHFIIPKMGGYCLFIDGCGSLYKSVKQCLEISEFIPEENARDESPKENVDKCIEEEKEVIKKIEFENNGNIFIYGPVEIKTIQTITKTSKELIAFK